MPFENHAPNPREATSPAEFVEQLRRLKAWSDRTYRRLEKEAARRGHALPHSTIATALARESLPRTELVAGLVSACGCDEETVALWVDVRRRLATSEVSPPPPADAETAGPPDAGTAATRRLARPTRIAAVLLAGLLVTGASSRPAAVRRTITHPSGAARTSSAAGSGALPSPAAWWRFEETGGTTARDSSGHGMDAAIGGDAALAPVPGGGHALVLAGSGHAATRGPVVRTDGAFTLTAWVRLDETGDWGTVVGGHDLGRAPDVVLLDYDAEHRDWAFLMPDRGKGWAMGDETVFSGLRPVRGRWTHLAVVHDPAVRRVCLYVDGRPEACRRRDSLARATGPLDIGRALAKGEPVDGWHGAIDDVRVFARALTDAQVREVASRRA